MKPAAHSPPKSRSQCAFHSYADHIAEALKYGLPQAKDMLSHASFGDEQIQAVMDTLKAAMMLHDMGKLDEKNQPVLRGESNSGLEIDHIEAGVTVAAEIGNLLLAWLIRGHHVPGLPDYDGEEGFADTLDVYTDLDLGNLPHLRGLRYHRRCYITDEQIKKHVEAILHTDEHFEEYKKAQIEECGNYPQVEFDLPDSTLTTRMLLSCLVDPDHESAAMYEKGESMPEYCSPHGRWKERLKRLESYVLDIASKADKPTSQRNQLRAAFYRCSSVKSSIETDNVISCSAPVGLGKTTSVTANLLQRAEAYNLRRLFVIAPFTNLINQTVKTLRKALVLAGEQPEQIVVAHHHKADFSDKNLRQYTVLWKAPVVVTTAVQFFETLASANPSCLRKLNSLPGSAIFIDESHACLPPHLLRLAWKWLRELAENWGCHIVLSSGSQVEFWKKPELVGEEHIVEINDLIDPGIKKKALELEQHRVQFKQLDKPVKLIDLINNVICSAKQLQDSGVYRPCALVIMNTVQSAAVVANALAKQLGQSNGKNELSNMQVLHISTALTPLHRELVLAEVERRDKKGNDWSDKAWYLVATSCVEAGVELDFAVGYRERSSVTSFLQVAGRINRHDIRDFSLLYDFITLPDRDGLNYHPGFKDSISIFNELWPEVQAGNSDLSTLATKSITREMKMQRIKQSKTLLQEDNDRNFQKVMQSFQVIESVTQTVIVDKELAERLEQGVSVHWQEIQNKSVQLWCTNINKFEGFLSPISNTSKELYVWNNEYDDKFLGFMAGVLKIKDFFENQHGLI